MLYQLFPRCTHEVRRVLLTVVEDVNGERATESFLGCTTSVIRTASSSSSSSCGVSTSASTIVSSGSSAHLEGLRAEDRLRSYDFSEIVLYLWTLLYLLQSNVVNPFSLGIYVSLSLNTFNGYYFRLLCKSDETIKDGFGTDCGTSVRTSPWIM